MSARRYMMAQERGVKFDRLQVVDGAYLVADVNAGKHKPKIVIPEHLQFDPLHQENDKRIMKLWRK